MSKKDDYLKILHQCYKEWNGQLKHTVEFRKDSDSDSVPTTMDILFFVDEPKGEKAFTIAATAGMSIFPLPKTSRNVELLIGYYGALNEKERQAQAKAIAELATIPFRDEFELETPMTLGDVNIPPFDKMTSVLVTQWNYLSEEFLPDSHEKLPQPVELLRITPIYESEQKALNNTKKFSQTMRKMMKSSSDLSDPNRKPIDLK